MGPRDVRDHLPLKPLDFGILLVLAEGEEYGYGIVKRIARPEAGGIRLAPSNLYHVLDRMIGAGLVEETEPSDPVEDGVRRKYYRITRLGRRAAAAEADRLADVMRTAKRLELGRA